MQQLPCHWLQLMDYHDISLCTSGGVYVRLPSQYYSTVPLGRELMAHCEVHGCMHHCRLR